MPSINSVIFERFSDEANTIGWLLMGYSALEIDLMNLCKWARDLDVAVKGMYRARGESARLQIADALARPHYRNLGLGSQFERAISAMGYCRKIRNQYSHCLWHDDNSGQLAFVDLEELAELNTVVVNLTGLTLYHVDVTLLKQQAGYFAYTEALIVWLNYEGRRLTGQDAGPARQEPIQQQRPSLHLPITT
jgi:hypothetical protein